MSNQPKKSYKTLAQQRKQERNAEKTLTAEQLNILAQRAECAGSLFTDHLSKLIKPESAAVLRPCFHDISAIVDRAIQQCLFAPRAITREPFPETLEKFQQRCEQTKDSFLPFLRNNGVQLEPEDEAALHSAFDAVVRYMVSPLPRHITRGYSPVQGYLQ